MKKQLLLLVLLIIGLPSLVVGQSPVNVQKSNSKPIYMHMMPWFDGPMTLGAGNWGYHWKMQNKNPNIVDGSGKRQIASNYYPQIGPYDSSDPDVVDYQLLLMKLSGVDGVLIDWYGTAGTVGDINSNLRNSNAIVNGTAPAGLKFGLVVEDRFTGGDVNTQRNSMLYARDNYFNRSNYFRFGPSNSPLVGIFGPTSIQYASGWNTIMSGIDAELLPLEYQNGEVGGIADGEYAWPYQSPGTSDHATQVENFYRNRAPGLRTAMGVAYPGFNDFYAQGGAGQTLFNIPFNGTGTLNQMLNLANQYSSVVDIIQLATWNDYGEGTMFEPTQEFGYSFLVKLQQFTGVPYTESDLKQVTRYYNLRKKYAGNASVKTKLDQVYKYFAALQISNAVALMCTIENDGTCVTAVPVITSSLSASGNVGSAFNYTITASNAPTSYSATGLPAGLSVNTSNGVISGTPTTAATSNVTIKATNGGGSDTKTLVLTISNTPCVTVTGISLNTGSQSLSAGQTSQLTATVAPSNACNKTVNWNSSNTAVATVNSSGTVTAVGAGNATITAITVDQNKTATSTVTVTAGGGTVIKYYRIKNRWQPAFYLYDGGNQVSYGTGTDQSYQWTLEDVGGGNMEIKNRATGEYMHVEHLLNYVEATARTSGWYSSRWAIENTGDGYVRFRNAWQSTQYINIENLYGYAQHTAINTTWASVQWLLEEVTTSTPPPSNPSAVLIQAESYSSMSGIQTESTSDADGGLNVGWIDGGDWMAYAGIIFPTSGAYKIEYRVASVSGASLSLDLNNGSIQLGTLAIPATGGWQTWQTISHVVNVNAGTYSVGVYAPAGGWNINWIRITKQTTARTSNDEATSDASASGNALTLYPNPTENILHLSSGMDIGTGHISILDIVGKEVYSANGNESIDVSSLAAGSYTLIFTADNERQVLRFVKR
ncbi:MAG: hypothetical protein JWM14_1454 [Chitinophagaceae bacterium]|nr:hypothetical protein [Chitinophagaceae bacterium]